MHLAGVNEPISNATVAVAPAYAGAPAYLDSGTNFAGYANVSSGISTVQVEVADFNGNTVADYYQVTLNNGTSQTLKYDRNGNLVSITNTTTGASMSNVWDAANRLVAIYSNGTYRSVFAYDGLGRRVRQTEISGTTTISDNWMLWCGTELCEKRDSTGGVVSNRFFAQGEQISGAKYYYTRDHLASVREMTDSSGNVRAEYNYDLWGWRTRVGGNGPDADFGFTGHYYHAPSGLDLTFYRAYSADLGRWLSRDPIKGAELIQGPNLYAYVADNPVNARDPLGLLLECTAKCGQQWINDTAACTKTACAAAGAVFVGCMDTCTSIGIPAGECALGCGPAAAAVAATVYAACVTNAYYNWAKCLLKCIFYG